MNAVEIEEAVSELVASPFDSFEFPYAFLTAFGFKETAIRRLKAGSGSGSDVNGGVLLKQSAHIAVCPKGQVENTLDALRNSPRTKSAKVKFVIATDGDRLEAEDIVSGEPLACSYPEFADHFGFFLPLAGISTIKEIKDNPIDIKATGRLNKLYLELLQDNPRWTSPEMRHELNQFMARIIFCFFAEDTGIFYPQGIFTKTVETMSDGQSSNTHEVLIELFKSMDTPTHYDGYPDERHRKAAGIKSWANKFPYVNGGLFSGAKQVPRFSRNARSYFLRIGALNWQEINPDIFGSMIQAVADDEERGALGMHYTSVPNILKVLNPLFLDDLKEKLDEAGDNSRTLLNLRKRMARIRVFDPACGSGNFLVIAYKEMRAIEAEINKRRGEPDRKSEIPLTNFRGIELRDFPVEIARLALVIAEYQCDVLYRGQKEALQDVLPLEAQNWIVRGNALQEDWLNVCPPNGIGETQCNEFDLELSQEHNRIDFENEGGETYICGNPPYLGSQDQSPEQKADLAIAFKGAIKSTKSADYVSGWFIKAREYIAKNGGLFAFVATNSICQGRQVALFWPAILGRELEIRFAVPSFMWNNLASRKATVMVSIIGVGHKSCLSKLLFADEQVRKVNFIGPYLVPDHDTVVSGSRKILSKLSPMTNGSMPNDGGGLLLDVAEYRNLIHIQPEAFQYCRRFLGSYDSIQGDFRYCLWISESDIDDAFSIPEIRRRIEAVRKHRKESDRKETNALSNIPYAFGERRHRSGAAILIPRHSSENRPYLPSLLVSDGAVIGDSAIAIYEFNMWDLSIYSSKLHLVWAATVCGKLEARYRYSNTLVWNTFPVPLLTEKNKSDLTRCAEDILLAREAHFPATIADLYDPETMPEDLRTAHERNDEILERIYIGRRFKNDTERLEKLFDMYKKMTNDPTSKSGSSRKKSEVRS